MIDRQFDIGRARALLALLVSLIPASTLAAQGTLSTQGFGYPVGGISTRSAGTAGAFADFDALSTWNPSSISGVQRAVLAAQTEPEYRSVQFGGVNERTRVQRVPLILALFPLPRNGGLALSAGTFLDRSFATTTTGTVDLGDEIVSVTDARSVRGAISDLRAAAGFRVNERVSVGIAGHLYVGSNEVALLRTFEDTVRFGTVADSSSVDYTGTALSIGADVRLAKSLALSAAYRHGNSVDARTGRQVLSEATMPSRIGATLRYDGIPGSVFAAGVERVTWGDLAPLGSSDVGATDAVNWHVGAEVAGPQFRQWPLQFRVGYANSQLPFGVAGSEVHEHRAAAGVGIPIAGDRASLDLSAQRAWRSLDASSARERAWRLGLGVQIRP